MAKFLGIDVGGGSIKAGVIDEEGLLLMEDKIHTDPHWSNDEFLKSIIRLTDSIVNKIQIDSIGIGTPGPIDIENGIILRSANLVNLKNVPLILAIKTEFEIPVYFNNDANCAALGEYRFGIGKGCQNLVVFTLGTGLGCGWALNGKIYNGYRGNGMETGHTTVISNGALCGCGGKGCIEAYFSTTGFLGRYREKTGWSPENAKAFFDLCKQNDSNAITVLDQGITLFSECIRNVVHMINPEKIVLVGGITASHEMFYDKLKDRVNEKIFHVFKDFLKIEIGKNLSGSYGAAALCIQEENL